MYCWVTLPFFWYLQFLLVILSHWLSFRASCTLIRPTFVWTRELVVISTPCIHSCRQPLSYVCLNRMYVWYSKFVWLARLSTSFRSWIFRSCDQFFFLELLENCVLQCPECNPFENYGTDCSNKFGFVWLNVELLCYFVCVCLCTVYAVLECFLTSSSLSIYFSKFIIKLQT